MTLITLRHIDVAYDFNHSQAYLAVAYDFNHSQA